jgi:hypothetical protein
MALEQSIWKIDGNKATKVREAKLDKELVLEEIINADISVLDDGWMLIGRQVRTSYDKLIDLLAVDRNGNLIIIELKRDRTPRDVVAQALDYASWIKDLKADTIAALYRDYADKHGIPGTLEGRFKEIFGIDLDQDQLNQAHKMVIVASELDASTERIVNYLSDSLVPINALFFKTFSDGQSTFLSRAWLIEPEETENNTVKVTERVAWNGEYYVSFGEGQRKWTDALKYGFISAGGGAWYSGTLEMLQPGARVWVNLPGKGYVACGRVLKHSTIARDAVVLVNGEEKRLLDMQLEGSYKLPDRPDEDQEYVVPVEWIKAVPAAEAYRETGFFGNQNSVCQPRAKSWDFTVQTLKRVWEILE